MDLHQVSSGNSCIIIKTQAVLVYFADEDRGTCCMGNRLLSIKRTHALWSGHYNLAVQGGSSLPVLSLCSIGIEPDARGASDGGRDYHISLEH